MLVVVRADVDENRCGGATNDPKRGDTPPVPSTREPWTRRFGPAIASCGAVAVTGVLAPDLVAQTVLAAVTAAIAALDGVFMAATSALLLIAAWIAVGRHGRRRLGADDARPEFSTFAWVSMLFAAGMGSGLMFWGSRSR